MVDIPADNTTTATVTIGTTFSNQLEVVGDLDWVRVNLVAGQTYEIALNSPDFDTILTIYSASTTFVASDDDGGVGTNSFLTFTPVTSGVFFLEVRDFGANNTGAYTFDVTEFVPPPPPPPLETIDWGTVVADKNVTVYFALAGETFDGYTSEGFNAYEKAQFQAAFDLIEAVCGLTFTVQNTPADFNLVLDTNQNNGDFLGFFNPPGTTNEGVGVFAGQSWDRAAGGSLDAGGYDFVTIVHELLHGLGFAHPHDTGGTSSIMDGVTAAFDDYGTFLMNQGIFTTMSYNTGYFTGTTGSQGDVNNNFGYEYGPMALDIALLQQKYGANTTTNAGNTTYVLDTVNAIGSFWRAIWDVSGTDEIRHDGAVGSTIDLRTASLLNALGGGGFVSAVNGIAGGFTIAANVVIENATGGSGGDLLIGNSAANTLNGRQGADTMTGGLGSDTYIVNETGDVINEGRNGGLFDRVLSGCTYTLAANDNIEILSLLNVRATADLDLTGNALAQRINGNAGENRLADGGGAGADTMTGLGGDDTYIVKNSGTRLVEGAGQGNADRVIASVDFGLTSGVYVEIMSTVNANGTAAIDLTGNASAQRIIGNAGANILNGRGGNDTMTGGHGADIFVFNTALGRGNIDRITDFNVRDDTIRLENSFFGGPANTTLSKNAFHMNETGFAHDDSDRIIYNSVTGNLFYDADGNRAGGVDRVQFATLSAGLLTLSENDFFLV